MRFHRFLVPLVVLLFSLVIAAPVSRAQSDSGATINTFITALNNGDLTTASAQISQSFTLTLVDGTTVTAPDAFNQITTPILIDSLSPTGNHQVNAVLEFGSSGPMNVSFTGGEGGIATMAILSPAR